MALCANCEHDSVDHDDDGCRYGRATPHSCRCLFNGKGIVLMGAKYEDAKPSVANQDRVKAADRQVGGDHYRQTGIQPWDVIDAYGLDFYEGSALKYLLRWRKKNGLEDLKKLRHYIDKLIELREEAE